uniref:Putative secreted protein n=1 Tax=Ixodes ricinus TaxID=34613 RepID=A0A6B0UD77_IXORI
MTLSALLDILIFLLTSAFSVSSSTTSRSTRLGSLLILSIMSRWFSPSTVVPFTSTSLSFRLSPPKSAGLPGSTWPMKCCSRFLSACRLKP